MTYRDHPEPGKMPRWFYWSPAHWRRWQVFVVVLLGCAALGRRVGCYSPPEPDVPVKITTEHGWTGWRLISDGPVDTATQAGALCPRGWFKIDSQVRPWHSSDYVVIECQDRTKGY